MLCTAGTSKKWKTFSIFTWKGSDCLKRFLSKVLKPNLFNKWLISTNWDLILYVYIEWSVEHGNTLLEAINVCDIGWNPSKWHRCVYWQCNLSNPTAQFAVFRKEWNGWHTAAKRFTRHSISSRVQSEYIKIESILCESKHHNKYCVFLTFWMRNFFFSLLSTKFYMLFCQLQNSFCTYKKTFCEHCYHYWNTNFVFRQYWNPNLWRNPKIILFIRVVLPTMFTHSVSRHSV